MKRKTCALFSCFLIICVLMSCGLLNNHLDKNQIFSLVKENEDLLTNALLEIAELDESVHYISTTQKSTLFSASDIGKNGLLFASLGDGVTSADNEILLQVMKLDGVQDISVGEVIAFSCGGKGMGPATSYYGFYYSESDDLTAIWYCNSNVDLEEYGDGWLQNESGGDNTYYTEKITGHFYYFEAHF